jgi:hypothetical protein
VAYVATLLLLLLLLLQAQTHLLSKAKQRSGS